jgi:hypothetical protein
MPSGRTGIELSTPTNVYGDINILGKNMTTMKETQKLY